MCEGAGKGNGEGSFVGTGNGICEGECVGRLEGHDVGTGLGTCDTVGWNTGSVSKAPSSKQNIASSESPVPRSVDVSMKASLISHEIECAGLVPSRAKAKQLLLPTHA
jgi:hypothetical protein